MAKKRLALDENGNLTYCEAEPENMGRGRCKHVDHQREGESQEQFMYRMAKKNWELTYKKFDNFDQFYDLTTKITGHYDNIPNEGTFITGNGEHDIKMVYNTDRFNYSMIVDGELVKEFETNAFKDKKGFDKFAKQLNNATIDFYSTEYNELVGAVDLKFNLPFLNKNIPYIYDGAMGQINMEEAKTHAFIHILQEKGVKIPAGDGWDFTYKTQGDIMKMAEELQLDMNDQRVKDSIDFMKNTPITCEFVYPEGCKPVDFESKDYDEITPYQECIYMEKEYNGVPTIVVGTVYQGHGT